MFGPSLLYSKVTQLYAYRLFCIFFSIMVYISFPHGAAIEKTPANTRDAGDWGFGPWVGKIPWRKKWQRTLVFLPGKLHGWRSLADYSPRCQSDKVEWLSTHAHWINFPVLFTLKALFINPINNSLHLLIPTPSPSLPHPTSPWQPRVSSLCLWVCFYFVIDSFVAYFTFFIQVIAYIFSFYPSK